MPNHIIIQLAVVSPYVMQWGEIASAILLRKGQKLHYHFFAKCIFLSMYAESVKKNVLVLVFSFNTAVRSTVKVSKRESESENSKQRLYNEQMLGRKGGKRQYWPPNTGQQKLDT